MQKGTTKTRSSGGGLGVFLILWLRPDLLCLSIAFPSGPVVVPAKVVADFFGLRSHKGLAGSIHRPVTLSYEHDHVGAVRVIVYRISSQ